MRKSQNRRVSLIFDTLILKVCPTLSTPTLRSYLLSTFVGVVLLTTLLKPPPSVGVCLRVPSTRLQKTHICLPVTCVRCCINTSTVGIALRKPHCCRKRGRNYHTRACVTLPGSGVKARPQITAPRVHMIASLSSHVTSVVRIS